VRAPRGVAPAGRIALRFWESLAVVLVREMTADDVVGAEAVHRRAFAAQTGDPSFGEGSDVIRTRHASGNVAGFVAEDAGALVGSLLLTRWGTFGVLGPLSVAPSAQGRGVARLLLDRGIAELDSWELAASGLYTFADSPKHRHLYERYGFVDRGPSHLWRRTPSLAGEYDVLPPDDLQARASYLWTLRQLTSSVLPGWDLTIEATSMLEQGLGSVVLPPRYRGLGFALCHVGAGSEAGPDACYVKAAVVHRDQSDVLLRALLEAVEAFAVDHGWSRLEAGAPASRTTASRALLDSGWTPTGTGMAMTRPGDGGALGPDAGVLDDWR
jgi:GNAT superfamily N-acetyltransferase